MFHGVVDSLTSFPMPWRHSSPGLWLPCYLRWHWYLTTRFLHCYFCNRCVFVCMPPWQASLLLHCAPIWAKPQDPPECRHESIFCLMMHPNYYLIVSYSLPAVPLAKFLLWWPPLLCLMLVYKKSRSWWVGEVVTCDVTSVWLWIPVRPTACFSDIISWYFVAFVKQSMLSVIHFINHIFLPPSFDIRMKKGCKW